MSAAGEPEVIPPEAPWPSAATEEESFLSDENLEHLVALLDDIFRIPMTGIRFGLDPVIGLIPGVGDWITGAISFLMLVAGWRRGLPRVALARMVVNIGIDSMVGTVPVVGDLFDVGWKANRRNLELLERHLTNPEGARRGSRRLVAAAVALAVLTPVVVLGALAWLVWSLFRALP